MTLILATALVLAIPITSPCDALNPPPQHGVYHGGWGMNPTIWADSSGSWTSGLSLYDPLYVGGGDAWVVGYDGNYDPLYIDYGDITLELWIEMNSIQTYQYTSYQWHEIGDANQLRKCVISGTCQSNNGQYICLVPGADPLDHLYFRENIFGNTTPGPGCRDIPITWHGRWGTGLVYGSNQVYPALPDLWGPPIPPDGNGQIVMLIEDKSDHWFGFSGEFTVEKHEPDGYYSLTLDGCPAPIM